MHRLRPLLVLAIAVIIGGVGATYWSITRRQQREATPPPIPLSTHLLGSATGWQWSYSQDGKTVVEVHAREMTQIKDPAVFDLTDVELKIFHVDRKVFDRVVSPKSQFSTADGKMFSDGDVEIFLAMAAGGSPSGRILAIRSSGVSFENKTGKADTDRHVTFNLDVGEGQSDGATYDPQIHELRLHRNAKLIWRGKDPKAEPMYIEAPSVLYKEVEQKIYLTPTAKFSRAGLSMTGGPTEITVEDGNIRLVQTTNATGTQQDSRRTVAFGAEKLDMIFRDKGLMEKITGQTNAVLESKTATARTVVRTQRLDLSFAEAQAGAELSRALASGASVMESFPVDRPPQTAPDTRVLKSEVIDLTMRPGGDEIDRINTHSPGTIDFLPNRPGGRKRHMEGERIDILYGSGNQIRSFRSVKVATRTEPLAQSTRKSAAPQLTWSDHLQAEFDPKTGDMTKLEQWNSFRFREGERQARADRAIIDQASDVVTLDGGARIWDTTGSTDADKIRIDNKQETTTASGKVRSVREPEPSGTSQTAREDKVRAIADVMVTSSNNSKIRYEGQALLWQGDNRIKADCIEIDRTAQQLTAEGDVVNHLKDQKQPITTVITSASMTYSDPDRVAFYEGNVVLDRPQLHVKSKRLRAYLSESQEETGATIPDSGLEKAFAEGSVEITQQDALRTRFGVGEAADYSVTDEMVILQGGAPTKLTETAKGQKPSVTEGQKLTWFANTGKLLVDGADRQRGMSNLRRKK